MKKNKDMEASVAADHDSVTNISNWPDKIVLILRYLPQKDLV